MMVQKQHFKPKSVLIMASGNGSNFEAIVKYFRAKGFQDKVKFELLCDKKGAPVLDRAKTLGIPAFCIEFEKFYDFLAARKGEYDLYVLAGFMRVLPEKILEISSNGVFCANSLANIINIHPSLLPEFKGKNAIARAFEAGAKETGVTVHFVQKEVDLGYIIARQPLKTEGLGLSALENEIHKIEHSIYPETIEKLLFKKNVLVFGGGAREHAIASVISSSPFLKRLYLANPNDGFKNLGETINFSDYLDLLQKSIEKRVDILVVGPENPLCEGIADVFEKGGIKVIGANKDWARLEGSKSFAKKFMQRNDIKTADYKLAFDEKSLECALEYFANSKTLAPPVIKADGLALGKGVFVPNDFSEAKKNAKEFLDGKFGAASEKILLEERLFGKEVSIISLWDGKTLVSFPPASDYKKLLEDDKGPNTGGMGAVAPSEITLKQKNEIEEYLKTLEAALVREKADFCGVIYSGLILTDDGPKVLEYNMRFGDPECQALLELLDVSRGVDLLDIFIKMTEKKLKKSDLKIADKKAYCLVLASDGYPSNPKKGAEIKNLDAAKEYGCKTYFAGVKTSQGSLTVSGGRVLSIVKSGEDTREFVYKTAESIKFDGKIYRKDIGKK